MELQQKLAYFISTLLALQELTEPVRGSSRRRERQPYDPARPPPQRGFEGATITIEGYYGIADFSFDIYDHFCQGPACQQVVRQTIDALKQRPSPCQAVDETWDIVKPLVQGNTRLLRELDERGWNPTDPDLVSFLTQAAKAVLQEEEPSVFSHDCNGKVRVDHCGRPQISQGGLEIVGGNPSIYQQVCGTAGRQAVQWIATNLRQSLEGQSCEVALDRATEIARRPAADSKVQYEFAQSNLPLVGEDLAKILAETAIHWIDQQDPAFFRILCRPHRQVRSRLDTAGRQEGGLTIVGSRWDLFDKYCAGEDLLLETFATIGDEIMQGMKACGQVLVTAMNLAQDHINRRELAEIFNRKGWPISRDQLGRLLAEYSVLYVDESQPAFFKQRCNPPVSLGSIIEGPPATASHRPPEPAPVPVPEPEANFVEEQIPEPLAQGLGEMPSTPKELQVFQQGLDEMSAGADTGYEWLTYVAVGIATVLTTAMAYFVYRHRHTVADYMKKKYRDFKGWTGRQATKAAKAADYVRKFAVEWAIASGLPAIPESVYATWCFVQKAPLEDVLSMLSHFILHEVDANTAVVVGGLPTKLSGSFGNTPLASPTNDETYSQSINVKVGGGTKPLASPADGGTYSQSVSVEARGGAATVTPSVEGNGAALFPPLETELAAVGDEPTTVPLVPEDVRERIFAELARPTVDPLILESFLRKSGLYKDAGFMEKFRIDLDKRYLVVQLAFAFILGNYGYRGNYLRLINHFNEDVNDLFLAFIQALVNAYFPRDARYVEGKSGSYTYQEEARQEAREAYKRYRQTISKPRSTHKNTRAEMLLMHEFIKWGRCREDLIERQYGTCDVAKKTFGKLAKTDWEHIAETQASNLLFLGDYSPTKADEKRRFLKAAAACSADTFAFAMRRYQVYDKRFLEGFKDFGECGGCRILRDYYLTMWDKRWGDPHASRPAVCIAEDRITKETRLHEVIPQVAIHEYTQMAGSLRNEFAKAFVILITGVQREWTVVAETLLDALNEIIPMHCRALRQGRPIVAIAEVNDFASKD